MTRIASKSSETRKRQGRIFPYQFRGSMTLMTLMAFGLLDSRTVRQQISVILSHPLCGTIIAALREIMQLILRYVVKKKKRKKKGIIFHVVSFTGIF